MTNKLTHNSQFIIYHYKRYVSLCFAGLVFFSSGCSYSPSQPPLGISKANLASFDIIKNTNIPEAEKKVGIINFNEFCRIYVYNYFAKKSTFEKQKILRRIQTETSNLKYSTKISSQRQPPLIMHWTDGNNAMGAIRTLFKERNMTEGVIGVDYIVSEPLKHPDYPERPAKSYTINLSKSDVATTWFHVPGQFRNSEDRKYNTAINIEVTGWRFLKNNKGKKNDFSRQGSLGIRETFSGDFKNLDKKYSIYPTVLKLVNYLAVKHNFTQQIDQFNPENEINHNLSKNGTLYLDGPLSMYLKGHGLIALEHSLKYGSKYRDMRHDFTPRELLVLYSDLKGYRQFISKKPSLRT